MALALYTFGQFLRPADDPINQGFSDLNDPVLAMADSAPGMIARSGYASDPGPAPWGPEVYPRFWQDNGDGWAPATLSLWQDLESVFAFTYFGLHAKAFARGHEWFQPPQWPPYVLWWHEGSARPTWAEAVARHEMLHDEGEGPQAFTFKVAFDPSGQPIKLDKARIQALRS